MLRNVLQVNQPQIGRPGNGFIDGGDRWDTAAWKDIALDKIHRSLVAIKNLIANGYGLQRHQAVIFQQSAASSKECGVKMMADGLDHFDGDQFVKFSAQIAVVIPL